MPCRGQWSLVAFASLVAAFGCPAEASATALPSGCSQSGAAVACTQTFTSGSNPFTVPAGVFSVHVVAIGGEGGTSAGTAAPGGFGAEVTGNLPVTPGTTLYAVVGSNAEGQTPGANGGGPTTGSPGGAGGGASDVRAAATDLTSRLLVAAGGGGGGGDGSAPFAAPGAGGSGGGQAGAAGDPTFGQGGGGGATSSAGGAGGAGASALGCFRIPPDASQFCPYPGGAGASGVSGSGGAGGAPGGFMVTNIGGSFNDPGGAGGGGGGGWFGGGGGGGGGSGAGGGGGGSNLVPPGGFQTVDTSGTPMVQISYTYVPATVTQQPAPQATISTPPSGVTYALNQSVATSFTCSEAVGGPGLASCDDSNGTSTVSGGSGHLNTATLGPHTYTVAATSKDGETGTASITYTVVAVTVSITTRRARYSHGRTAVRLACAGPAGAACTGRLELTIRVKRAVDARRGRVTASETVVLAQARYVVATGASLPVTLNLGHRAKALLAERTVRVRASATVEGGKTADREITLAPAPARPESPTGMTASFS
ncbi:MAG TPA: hypothetical protein VKR21_16605 [Solirubrobacteraceae bacterium]|nr:hypothetical protein [Solirubrobacteraceae bacterium]